MIQYSHVLTQKGHLGLVYKTTPMQIISNLFTSCMEWKNTMIQWNI